jgi:ribose/xylose/arabinose/galactoside ABC-type transport system permease subunit
MSRAAEAGQQAAWGGLREALRARVRRDWNSVVVPLFFVALIALFSALHPNYFTYYNFANVLRQISILAVVTIGMSFVVFGGGFDLSAGSVVALAGTLGAIVMLKTSILVGVLTGVAVGLLVGLVNGAVIAYLNVSPFIVTLATMYIARDAALLVSEGVAIYNLPPAYGRIGSASWLGIPILFYGALGVYAIFHVLLNQTHFGMKVYAVGGNRVAARLSGISVKGMIVANFGICGMLSGLAGMMLDSRTGSGEPTAGAFYELEAIAGVVLGGAALMGGSGKLWRSMMGIAMLGVLSNGLNILGVHHYWKGIVVGMVLLGAASLDMVRRGR